LEAILWGSGGTVTFWELTEQAYNYWKDKPRKMLFDFSWNLPDLRSDNVFDEEHPPRDKLGVPDEAWFFEPRDQIWRGDKIGRFKSNCLDICEYDKAMIFINDNNEITMHHPDELPFVRYEYKFKPKSDIYYSAVSTEVGNWSHKWYSRSIPLGKFRLHTVIINDKKYIISLEPKTSAEESWDMYEEVRVDWSYRLHIRNQVFINDMIEYTGIDLNYDMNTGNHEQDCSHFKVHHD